MMKIYKKQLESTWNSTIQPSGVSACLLQTIIFMFTVCSVMYCYLDAVTTSLYSSVRYWIYFSDKMEAWRDWIGNSATVCTIGKKIWKPQRKKECGYRLKNTSFIRRSSGFRALKKIKTHSTKSRFVCHPIGNKGQKTD